MKHLAPTLAQKLARLREFYHHREEPELSLQAVATVVGQKVNKIVPVEMLEEVESGELTSLPLEISDAICDTFGVSRDYLRLSGEADIDHDQRLRLWILIRDRGLDHFSARSARLTREDFEELIAQVATMQVATISANDQTTRRRLKRA